MNLYQEPLHIISQNGLMQLVLKLLLHTLSQVMIPLLLNLLQVQLQLVQLNYQLQQEPIILSAVGIRIVILPALNIMVEQIILHRQIIVHYMQNGLNVQQEHIYQVIHV